jgi:hypothetical protein
MLLNLGTDKGTTWSINMDYVINLYLKETEIEGRQKYVIVARMIDASLIPLQYFDTREDGMREYDHLIKGANCTQWRK